MSFGQFLKNLTLAGVPRVSRDSNGNPVGLVADGKVIAIGGGSALAAPEINSPLLPASQITTLTLTASLTPAATPTYPYEQVFTVPGLQAGDVISNVTKAAAQAGLSIQSFRLASPTQIGITFNNSSGASITPTAGETYTITVSRFSSYADLPHVGVVAPGAATKITGTTQSINATDERIRHCGAITPYTAFGGGTSYGPASTSYHPSKGVNGKSGSLLRYDFMTDAPKLEILCTSNGAVYRVIVDDKVVSPDILRTYNGYGQQRLLVDFTQGGAVITARKPRSVRIEGYNQASLIGLTLGAADSIWRPTTKVRAVMFGDSYVQGLALPSPYTAFANTLGYSLGWDELIMSGVSNTGYLKFTAGDTLKWRDRISDLTGPAPDAAVVVGSVNDQIGNGFSIDQLQEEMALFWQQAAAALPKTIFFVTGAQQPRANFDAAYNVKADAYNAALQEAVSGLANVRYIDTSTWFTGTGNSASPNNTGNSDALVQGDGTHLTQAGHDYFAFRLGSEIRALMRAS